MKKHQKVRREDAALVIQKKNSSRRNSPRWRKALTWAVTAWTLGMAPAAYASDAALPVLDAKDAAVSIVTSGNVMNINSGAQNNLIKWVDFSIASGKTVDFHDKNYLNYVTGSAVSDIYGTLAGTGSIYLVNPNGILIHDNAVINVGSLHLSTKDLTDNLPASYADGMSKLANASIGGDVINLGRLNATSITVEGKNITFKNVEDVTKGGAIGNDGKITGGAQNTSVSLAADGEIHLGFAVGEEATSVNDTQYTSVTLPDPTGWTFGGKNPIKYMLVRNAFELQNMRNNYHERKEGEWVETFPGSGISIQQNVPAHFDGNYMLAGDIDAGVLDAFTPIGNGRISDFQPLSNGNYVDDVFGVALGTLNSNAGTSKSNSFFTGRFDGLNYKVSNLHLSVSATLDARTSTYSAGLFGAIGEGGVVENLEVAGTTTVSNTGPRPVQSLGAVAGMNLGTLRNVRNTSAITYNNAVDWFGGVAGLNMGTIDKAYNTGALSGSQAGWIGGVAGQHGLGTKAAVITNAFNAGVVTNSRDGGYVGGIAGALGADSFTIVDNGWNISAYSKSRIENAYNSGKVRATGVGSGAGGIVGGGNEGTVNCTYNGATGGIFGANSDVSVVSSYATQGKTKADYTGFDFSENGPWRIYEGKTAPLLTAFLTRKDNITSTTEYNGSADAGATYAAVTTPTGFNPTNAQTGYNYIKNVSIVTPLDLTVSFDNISKTYDGTTNATEAGTATLDGKVGTDDVSLDTTNLRYAYADKNADTNKTVNYTGIALSGEKAKNYNLTGTTYDGKGDITAKELTVSFADISKTYDGTTDAAAGKGTLTGVIDGDTVSVAATGGTFADKNVGTNKSISYTGVVLDGDDKGNYSIAATATGKGSIAKADITISTDAVTKTYDGTTNATGAAAKVTSGTLFTGDSISGGTFAFADKNAGTGKTVTVSDVTVDDGNNGGNYNVTYASNTASTINKKNLDAIYFGSTTKEYDGTLTATLGEATLYGLIAADKTKVSVTANAAYEDENAGTDKQVNYTNIALTGAEAGNYQLPVTSWVNNFGTITRKALELVATPQTITEGEATPTTWSGTVTGFVEGEGLTDTDSLAFALDNPAASAVGSYAVTGSLNGNSFYDYGTNYNFSNAEANKTAFTIKAKQPDPVTPDPVTPDPVNPDPVTPDPVTPDPVNPDPATPDPATPDPVNPKPDNLTPEDIINKVIENKEAAKEYTDVVGSINSGASTAMPTGGGTPVLNAPEAPTQNAAPTTGATGETQSAAAQERSGGEAQQPNGNPPQQQTTGGQIAAGKQETQLGITYTDINMPESMSVEALATSLNGGATATTPNNAGGEATQNAPATEPTATLGGDMSGVNEEDEA